MPTGTPPPEAIREFLGATTRHIRRIEIYEQDGITRWTKDTETRLKGGGVSVDYDRDERRSLDLVLTNYDGGLINAPGEFWYDKIIKVFRGVIINAPTRQPRIVVISDNPGSANHALALRHALLQVGFGDVTINVTALDYDAEVAPFDIVVALGDTNKGDLLAQAYASGKSVFVIRRAAEFFFNSVYATWPGSNLPLGDGVEVRSRSTYDPRTIGWTFFDADTDPMTYKAPAAELSSRDVFTIAFAPGGGETLSAITSSTNVQGGRYIAVHIPISPYQYAEQDFQRFLTTAFAWLNPVVAVRSWEVQIGEFMVDRISEPHFPQEMRITGRDYAKKCMLSKYSEATQYAEGLSLESIIGVIAINAGITKRSLPITNIVVGRAFFFERGTSRWEAMKEICTAYNYEIYFDATGYLVIRPFRDPSTAASVVYIETGEEGQVASYEKSTSDGSLFNHVLVTGESSDQDVIPVWAEARNTDPNSPTNISEIGDRYWEYSSAFITTVQQAAELADSYLAIHQLEEFELSFETLLLPWLEVGDIIGWRDPNPAPGDPATFLLSSLDLPLALAPMGGVGRRVTIVSSGE